MESRHVIFSLILILFLIPLGIFNFPVAKAATPSIASICPQSSAELTCEFNYPDFSTATGLVLNGNAFRYAGNVLRLTSNTQNQVGSAWYDQKQNVSLDFTTVFRFQITPPGGADGFAFVIQNSSPTALGNSGLGLGYGGIRSSVAVEFDTYRNSNQGDISDHEIAIHTNDTGQNSADESFALPPGPIISPIEFQTDQQPHVVKVTYIVGVLEVFLDDFNHPVLSVSLNLKSRLGLSDGAAYVGFTGSDGPSITDNHDILDWFFVNHVSNSNAVQNGDFSNNLLDWTPGRTTIVQGSRGQYPIFQTLAEMPAPSTCTPSGRRGTTFLAMDTAFGASGYVEQQVTIPSNAHLTLVSWGWESDNSVYGISGVTNATVAIVDSRGSYYTLDFFTPPSMLNVADPSNVALDSCTNNPPISRSYDLSTFAGQTVKLRLGAQSSNCCGTLTAFSDVSIEAPGIAVFQCPPLAGFSAVPVSCPLPNATPGQFYTYQLQVSGGVPPYDFTKVSGALPPGLTLETNGDIHGTATSTGVFPLTLTVQDQGTTLPTTITVTITVPPIVTNVTPAAGPVTGGTSVNVTGIGFSKATSLSFNSTTASYQTESDTLIHVASVPSSQTGCILVIFNCQDVPGNANVSIAVGSYHSSFWCLSANPSSTNVQFVSLPDCNQFTYVKRGDVQYCSNTVSLPGINNQNIRFQASVDASIAVADAEFSGSFSINPQARYCDHLAGGHLNSFNFTTTVDYSASALMDLSLTSQYDNANKPFVLAGPFQSAPIIAGPIILVPTITPVLLVNASASASINGAFSYSSETKSTLSFNMTTAKWSLATGHSCILDPATGHVPGLSTLCLAPGSTSMTVAGSVKVAIGVQFSLLMYDIAGPVVTPDVYLRLDGGMSTTPSNPGPSCEGLPEGDQPGSWAALCAGLEVGVGVQLNPLLDFLLPSSNWTPYKFDVTSSLLAATVSASPTGPNVTNMNDGTFKLDPGKSTVINVEVAGSNLPTFLTASSSWNPTWSTPTCGTLEQPSPGTLLFTAPNLGGLCEVQLTKNFLGRGLLPGSTLYFRIGGVPPSAPQAVRATAQSDTIAVQWNSPSSDGGSPITSYKLYRGTVSGGESFVQTIQLGSSVSDMSVVCQTTYFYKVSAVNIAGEGTQSAEAFATAVCAASAPLDISSRKTAGGIQLSWQEPLSNGGSVITGYKIYRGTSSGQESFLVTVGPVTSYTDSSVISGTTYYYQIQAINAAGNSGLSQEASSTAGLPAGPSSGSAIGGVLVYGLLGVAIAVVGLTTAVVLLRRKKTL